METTVPATSVGGRKNSLGDSTKRRKSERTIWNTLGAGRPRYELLTAGGEARLKRKGLSPDAVVESGCVIRVIESDHGENSIVAFVQISRMNRIRFRKLAGGIYLRVDFSALFVEFRAVRILFD